jgi:serine/threonine protein kinase
MSTAKALFTETLRRTIYSTQLGRFAGADRLGVVKELATRIFTSVASSAPVTTVGKVGYAPSEQIQTGRAYPSSDLYSLAATAVVLLTGKEPQALFDDNQLTWSWRRWGECE